jgi:hypothetical protein
MSCHDDDEMEGRNTLEETPTHNHNPQPTTHNHTPTSNMSSLLEKSLDEIIGSRPRNVCPQHSRNPIRRSNPHAFVNILTPKHRHLPREVTGPQSHVIPTVLDTHHVVSKHHANNMQTAVQH